MTQRVRARIEDVPGDNSARLAIFDALSEAIDARGITTGLSEAAVRDRIIGRLRVLVPQELHNLGEDAYVAEKVRVAVEAGIAQWTNDAEPLLVLGEARPFVRYPDGSVRPYTAGLEAARERLDADEHKLRRAGFDVRHHIRPAPTKRKSDSFRRLLDSMAEHGFLDQCPLIESRTHGIIDGLARRAAAAEVGISLKKQNIVPLQRRRDTLLQNALLVLDVNAERLTEEDYENVRETIAARVQRPWLKIRNDLQLTREWRGVKPKEYDAKLEVEFRRYGDHQDPKVQVTIDGTRVMLRSLMQQAGLPEYQRDLLKPFVAMEDARTQISGRKAIFVGIDDAIDGIAKMKRTREREGLQVDPAWSDMRQWLVDTLRASTERSSAIDDSS